MIIIQSVAYRDEAMSKLKFLLFLSLYSKEMLVERVQPISLWQCDQAHNVWYFRAEALTINAHAGLEV